LGRYAAPSFRSRIHNFVSYLVFRQPTLGSCPYMNGGPACAVTAKDPLSRPHQRGKAAAGAGRAGV
jgi:hypothetical protein